MGPVLLDFPLRPRVTSGATIELRVAGVLVYQIPLLKGVETTIVEEEKEIQVTLEDVKEGGIFHSQVLDLEPL